MAVIQAHSTCPTVVTPGADQALSLSEGGKPPLSGHIGLLSLGVWLWSETDKV